MMSHYRVKVILSFGPFRQSSAMETDLPCAMSCDDQLGMYTEADSVLRVQRAAVSSLQNRTT